MSLKKTFIATATALTLPVAASAAVEIGTLTCEQADRTNLLVFSQAKYLCMFDPVEGQDEAYTATFNKVGIDMSSKKLETMVWNVLAPSSDNSVGALEGNFYGAGAEAALGEGLGAHVLVGGFDKSFTLQPVSFSGIEESIGFAAAIEEFRLDVVDNQ